MPSAALTQIGPGSPLTDRQREVIDMIGILTRRYGFAPTVRELGKALGIKSAGSGIADHLRTLRRRGLITWIPGRARTLKVVGAP